MLKGQVSGYTWPSKGQREKAAVDDVKENVRLQRMTRHKIWYVAKMTYATYR